MDTRRHRTRLKLQAALRALLAEKPLAEISVEELARRAGKTRQTFYANYRDLAEMLDEYVTDLLDLLARRSAMIDPDCTGEDRLAAHRDKFAGIFRDIDRSDPRLAALLQGVPGLAPQDRFAELLDDLLRRNPSNPYAHDPDLRRVAARFYSGAFIGVLNAWLQTPNPMPPERLAQAFTTLIFRGWPDVAPLSLSETDT
ncbi:TetR/AcrR family transcriptional regulator [Roseivivax sp. CAU 1753]